MLGRALPRARSAGRTACCVHDSTCTYDTCTCTRAGGAAVGVDETAAVPRLYGSCFSNSGYTCMQYALTLIFSVFDYQLELLVAWEFSRGAGT
eukprot:COSAG05_NODE_247_length_12967_cov_6.810538_3_plen_93_part_00